VYKKIKTLGQGSFGTAFLVECESTREYAVIKQIDIQALNEQERKEILREAKILEVVSRHPNIVRFREVYKTKNGRLCIVMDYADGGDIFSEIKKKV
jgi:NIMA (never in mitosis gene a)-related kinase